MTRWNAVNKAKQATQMFRAAPHTQTTEHPSSPAIQLSPHICDNARQIPTHIPHFLLSDRVSRLDVAVDACLKAPAATLATH